MPFATDPHAQLSIKQQLSNSDTGYLIEQTHPSCPQPDIPISPPNPLDGIFALIILTGKLYKLVNGITKLLQAIATIKKMRQSKLTEQEDKAKSSSKSRDS